MYLPFVSFPGALVDACESTRAALEFPSVVYSSSGRIWSFLDCALRRFRVDFCFWAWMTSLSLTLILLPLHLFGGGIASRLGSGRLGSCFVRRSSTLSIKPRPVEPDGSLASSSVGASTEWLSVSSPLQESNSVSRKFFMPLPICAGRGTLLVPPSWSNASGSPWGFVEN